MSGKRRDKEKQEKPIFGSGADIEQSLKGDGFVECVCTVACAWHGYHDEGDKVMVKRELLEGDPFFKGHFKAAEAQPGGQRSQDGEKASGGDGARSQTEDQAENADGGSETADGGNGQGELGLK